MTALVVCGLVWARHSPAPLVLPGLLLIAGASRAVVRGANRELAPLAVMVIAAFGFGFLALALMPITATDGLPLAVPIAVGCLGLALFFLGLAVLGSRQLLRLRRGQASAAIDPASKESPH